MNRLAAALVFLWSAAAAGCATSQLDRSFRAGEYGEVAALYESNPSLSDRESALFRVGTAYALPQSPVYDPPRARETFERLLTLFPASRHRAEVLRLIELLDENQRLVYLATERAREAERLAAEAALLREELETVRSDFRREEARARSLRNRLQNTTASLREAEEELRALQEELQRLKAVDLNLPPRTEPIPPPG